MGVTQKYLDKIKNQLTAEDVAILKQELGMNKYQWNRAWIVSPIRGSYNRGLIMAAKQRIESRMKVMDDLVRETELLLQMEAA